jgi:hypothetical protein
MPRSDTPATRVSRGFGQLPPRKKLLDNIHANMVNGDPVEVVRFSCRISDAAAALEILGLSPGPIRRA